MCLDYVNNCGGSCCETGTSRFKRRFMVQVGRGKKEEKLAVRSRSSENRISLFLLHITNFSSFLSLSVFIELHHTPLSNSALLDYLEQPFSDLLPTVNTWNFLFFYNPFGTFTLKYLQLLICCFICSSFSPPPPSCRRIHHITTPYPINHTSSNKLACIGRKKKLLF